MATQIPAASMARKLEGFVSGLEKKNEMIVKILQRNLETAQALVAFVATESTKDLNKRIADKEKETASAAKALKDAVAANKARKASATETEVSTAEEKLSLKITAKLAKMSAAEIRSKIAEEFPEATKNQIREFSVRLKAYREKHGITTAVNPNAKVTAKKTPAVNFDFNV